jgi:hypothetical protein
MTPHSKVVVYSGFGIQVVGFVFMIHAVYSVSQLQNTCSEQSFRYFSIMSNMSSFTPLPGSVLETFGVLMPDRLVPGLILRAVENGDSVVGGSNDEASEYLAMALVTSMPASRTGLSSSFL